MKIFTVTFKLTLYKKDSLLLQKEKKKKKTHFIRISISPGNDIKK